MKPYIIGALLFIAASIYAAHTVNTLRSLSSTIVESTSDAH